MNSDLEDKTLNALLAQPTQVSDRGFCRDTLKLIEKPAARKAKIFSAAGIAWLALAFVLASPAELNLQIQKFGDIFLSLFPKSLGLVELAQSSFPSSGVDFTLPTIVLFISVVLLWLSSMTRI